MNEPATAPENIKPPNPFFASYVRVAVTKLWIRFEKEEACIGAGFKVIVCGEGRTATPIGGSRIRAPVKRDVALTFVEMFNRDPGWHPDFEAWKAGLGLAHDHGGYVKVYEDEIDVFLEQPAFASLVSVVTSKSIAEIGLSLETDLWRTDQSRHNGPFFIPADVDKEYGWGFISYMSVELAPVHLGATQHAPTRTDQKEPHGPTEAQLTMVTRLMLWIVALLGGILACLIILPMSKRLFL